MPPCPTPFDIGPNILAVSLAAIAAIVSMYAAYRTSKVATAVHAAVQKINGVTSP